MDKENKKVKLTANILFSGIGCQERGFQDSGLFDLEVLNTSEINKEAMLSYAAIHCGLTNEMVETYSEYPSRGEMAQRLTDINLGYNPDKDKYFDWFKLAKRKSKDLEKYWLACKLTNNLGDISKINELTYADFWTCSFPCFTGDTLVLTKEYGYMPIKDITNGLLVLTHDNTYQTVTKSVMTGKKNIFAINAMCFDKLECTENHKFFTRTRHRVNTHIQGRAVNYRYFDKPIWKECKDLSKDDYLGYAINQNSIIPKWVDSSESKIKLSGLMDNKDFWWLIGRYIADGFKQTSKTGSKIVICCGRYKAKLGLIEKHLNACGLKYCTDGHKSCINYHVCSNELYKFVSQFGDRACGKFIPSFVFDMPIILCEAFLKGYWSGDGCFTQGRYKATSISKNLIYGIGQLIAKTYRRPFSIYFTKRKPTTIIEGRVVNQKDTYSVAFNKRTSKQDKAFYEDGYIWFPIKEISDTHTIKEVYDITVETNHSFTANGAIVHNCTDVSVAGKMKGLSPDTSTRSSLLWENIRLLKTAKENDSLPKYIMFENVKNLVSKRFIDDFNSLLEVLNELGFNSYWSVINGKNCGVPQNRERVFVVSIRKDIDNGKYTFPKPFDNGVRLKDVLEDTVDEKYYLSEDVQKRFKFTDKTFTKNVVGTTASLTASNYKQPKQILCGIDKSTKETKEIEYANCITAREDRGVSNRKAEGTAVLEQIGQLYGTEKEPNPQAGRVYDSTKLSPTIDSCGGGNRMPKIVEEKISHPEWKRKMYETGVVENFRIRKLTPRECYKLMGLTFDDCDKARAIGVADSHLYKQAGNGIITNCCELLAEHLYKAQYDDTYVCADENFTKPQVG